VKGRPELDSKEDNIKGDNVGTIGQGVACLRSDETDGVNETGFLPKQRAGKRKRKDVD